MIFSGPNDAATVAHTMARFGADVTSNYDGTSISAELSGVAWRAGHDACPHAKLTGTGLEYGTAPFEETLAARRSDQWLAKHPDAERGTSESIKAGMRRSFHDDSEAWQAMLSGARTGRDAAGAARAGKVARAIGRRIARIILEKIDRRFR